MPFRTIDDLNFALDMYEEVMEEIPLTDDDDE